MTDELRSPAPLSERLKMLAFELDAVLIDTKEMGKFDHVCRGTVQRVRDELIGLSLPSDKTAPSRAEDQDFSGFGEALVLTEEAVSAPCVVDAQLLRDIRHELGERMGFAESAHILCKIDAALAGSQPHLVKAILDPSVYDETEQYIAAAPAAQPNAELGTICPTCKEYVVKPLDERGSES